MNSTRRFAVRIGSAAALCALFAFGTARAANLSFVFGNQTLLFTHIARTAAGSAVGVDDPAFRKLLKSLDATLTWNPGERYVLIATPQPIVVNFSIGSKRYDVGLLSATASFAPFVQGGEAFLPLQDLLHALSLQPREDRGTAVLQPQLTSVDIEGSGNQAIVVAHAALPLHPRIIADRPNRVVYRFDGVASMIDGIRQENVGGIRTMQITTSGSTRHPETTVALDLAPRTRHGRPHSSRGDFEVGFGGGNSAPPLVAAAAESGVATEAAQPPAHSQAAAEAPVQNAAVPPAVEQGSLVSGISVQSGVSGATVSIAVSGNATYDWHRLRAPDNRFWIDIHGAQLQGGNRDEAEVNPLTSLRARQIDPQTVRVALSLSGRKALSVSPSASGIVIAVGNRDVADIEREGTGSIGTVVSANEPQPLITPVPPQDYGENQVASGAWKFGPRSTYVPTNPRLIVIDPGHGGSDRGAVRNGTAEASLNLMMALRLRTVLLARGWQVQMTHSTDVDVYRPNDSARDELQARDDIANSAGARLLVSIHCNSYINSGPSGTTTYYAKPIDRPLARIMEDALVANLGTKDDGIVKSHLYIPLHANMPSVLIETAFLSNPNDYAKLTSPDWQERVADDIADGIDQYTKEYPVSGQAQ